MPQAGVPQGQRTMMPGSPAPAAAPNPYQTQYQIPPQYPPASPQDGTMMPQGAPQFAAAAPPAAPARKPVALLVLLALLILGAFGAGATVLVQSALGKKGGVGVLGSKQAALPAGPGAALNSSPQSPQGPGVMNAIGSPPPVGAPVTAHKGQNPDLPPSMLLSQGQRSPSSPSVLTLPTRTAPPGPSPLQVAPTPPPSGPSVAMQAPRTPPPPPDNSDFDRYLVWLRRVEEFRAALRAEGETQSFGVISDFFGAMMGLSDPDANDMEIQQRFNQGLMNKLNAVVHDIRLTLVNIQRTKPPVPDDCRALDLYYTQAVRLESEFTVRILQALATKNIGMIRSLGTRASSEINQNLGRANLKLREAYRGRGLNQLFEIETGSNGSMLGGLGGLKGLPGM